MSIRGNLRALGGASSRDRSGWATGTWGRLPSQSVGQAPGIWGRSASQPTGQVTGTRVRNAAVAGAESGGNQERRDEQIGPPRRRNQRACRRMAVGTREAAAHRGAMASFEQGQGLDEWEIACMATNNQTIYQAFEVLTPSLARYIARELRDRYSGDWWDRGVLEVLHEPQRRNLPAAGTDSELIVSLDAHRCLLLINIQWRSVFGRKFNPEHRAWVNELIAVRNRTMHAGHADTSDDAAWRALDTLIRLAWNKRLTH